MSPTAKRIRILNLIAIERIEQDKKFGDQSKWSQPEWHTILSEEVGEVAHEINEKLGDQDGWSNDERLKLIRELVQVAAVCVSWLEQQHDFWATDLDRAFSAAKYRSSDDDNGQ